MLGGGTSGVVFRVVEGTPPPRPHRSVLSDPWGRQIQSQCFPPPSFGSLGSLGSFGSLGSLGSFGSLSLQQFQPQLPQMQDQFPLPGIREWDPQPPRLNIHPNLDPDPQLYPHPQLESRLQWQLPPQCQDRARGGDQSQLQPLFEADLDFGDNPFEPLMGEGDRMDRMEKMLDELGDIGTLVDFGIGDADLAGELGIGEADVRGCEAAVEEGREGGGEEDGEEEPLLILYDGMDEMRAESLTDAGQVDADPENAGQASSDIHVVAEAMWSGSGEEGEAEEKGEEAEGIEQMIASPERGKRQREWEGGGDEEGEKGEEGEEGEEGEKGEEDADMKEMKEREEREEMEKKEKQKEELEGKKCGFLVDASKKDKGVVGRLEVPRYDSKKSRTCDTPDPSDPTRFCPLLIGHAGNCFCEVMGRTRRRKGAA